VRINAFIGRLHVLIVAALQNRASITERSLARQRQQRPEQAAAVFHRNPAMSPSLFG
jgi:hypothetical protein